jgi:hypothetical protein
MPHRTRHAQHVNHFDTDDPSIHMLGLPKSHPKLRIWCVFAILTGAMLALGVVALGNLIF